MADQANTQNETTTVATTNSNRGKAVLTIILIILALLLIGGLIYWFYNRDDDSKDSEDERTEQTEDQDENQNEDENSNDDENNDENENSKENENNNSTDENQNGNNNDENGDNNNSSNVTPTIIKPENPIPGTKLNFFRGINIGGDQVKIDGYTWDAGKESNVNFEFEGEILTYDNSSSLNPVESDSNKAQMIRDFIWHGGDGSAKITLKNIPNGDYWVYVYTWEDTAPTVFDMYINGVLAEKGFNSEEVGKWSKMGPYLVNVRDGKIEIITVGGDANISGIEILQVISVGGVQPGGK